MALHESNICWCFVGNRAPDNDLNPPPHFPSERRFRVCCADHGSSAWNHLEHTDWTFSHPWKLFTSIKRRYIAGLHESNFGTFLVGVRHFDSRAPLQIVDVVYLWKYMLNATDPDVQPSIAVYLPIVCFRMRASRTISRTTGSDSFYFYNAVRPF